MGEEGSSSGVTAHWLQAIGTLISAIVAVVAGYFALTTYMDSVAKQADERIVQVFNMHQRFSTEPMLSIRKRIYGDLVRAAGCNWQNDTVASPSDQNDRFAFIEFFDVVHACVAAKLCDRDLVERLFVAYANGHWNYLSGYVQAVRKGEEPMKLPSPFGIGLEVLAKTPTALRC